MAASTLGRFTASGYAWARPGRGRCRSRPPRPGPPESEITGRGSPHVQHRRRRLRPLLALPAHDLADVVTLDHLDVIVARLGGGGGGGAGGRVRGADRPRPPRPPPPAPRPRPPAAPGGRIPSFPPLLALFPRGGPPLPAPARGKGPENPPQSSPNGRKAAAA